MNFFKKYEKQLLIEIFPFIKNRLDIVVINNPFYSIEGNRGKKYGSRRSTILQQESH